MRRLSIFLISGGLLGCSPGLLYTNMTVPLTTNMDKTPRGVKLATINTKHLKAPAGMADISVEWNSRAIGDAAKRAGLNRVYYADMNTVSVLGGIWQRKTIRVWGE